VLRSAIEGFCQDVAGLPDALVEEEFTELYRASEAIQAKMLARLRQIESRGIHERDGHLSAVAWLVDRFRMAGGLARSLVRTARALAEMPRAREAFCAGEISSSCPAGAGGGP